MKYTILFSSLIFLSSCQFHTGRLLIEDFHFGTTEGLKATRQQALAERYELKEQKDKDELSH